VPTLSSVPAEAGRPDAAGAVLDVAVPVHDEEAGLEPCVRRLLAHLRANFPHPFRITIADNASTDTTLDVARRLARELPEVTAVHPRRQGTGPGAAGGLVGLGRPDAGLHGRRPVDRPGGAAAAGHAGRPVLGRPVRLQGDPQGRGRPAAAPRRGHRLVLRHRAAGPGRATGLRIHEVPVEWVDDPDSRVDLLVTAVADLKGIVRVGRAPLEPATPGCRLA